MLSDIPSHLSWNFAQSSSVFFLHYTGLDDVSAHPASTSRAEPEVPTLSVASMRSSTTVSSRRLSWRAALKWLIVANFRNPSPERTKEGRERSVTPDAVA